MYPPLVQKSIEVNLNAYRELSPKHGPPSEARKLFEGVGIEDLFDAPIVSPVHAYATLAGLWLWNDALDECHQIVQQSPKEILAALNLHSKGKKPSQNMDSVQSVENQKVSSGQDLREMEATLNYWHGVMHRREGDFSNAKYWFRRVGNHAVLDALGPVAQRLGEELGQPALADRIAQGGDFDAFAMVDACQAALRSGGAAEAYCRRVQQAEWELLFDYCYRAAVD